MKTVPVQHVINKRQFNWYNVLLVIVMSLGALTYGYSTAIIGPTLGLLGTPRNIDKFILTINSSALFRRILSPSDQKKCHFADFYHCRE
jgi:hypothetical protein